MRQLLPGYVLHQRPFRDHNQLVEIFTPEHGRQGTIARRSRRRPLQPFQPLWLELGGRGELRTMRHWEPRGRPLWLNGDLLVSAIYINELLYRLLHRDDPHPDLFAGYEAALEALATIGAARPSDGWAGDGGDNPDPAGLADLEWVLRRFELLLLETLGYALDLDADNQGRPLDGRVRYQFHAGAGLAPAAGDDPGLLGQDLIDYQAGRHTPAARRAFKLVCRKALAPHLGARPLLSRQLFPRGD